MKLCANYNTENRSQRCKNERMPNHIHCERCYREAGGYVRTRRAPVDVNYTAADHAKALAQFGRQNG